MQSRTIIWRRRRLLRALAFAGAVAAVAAPGAQAGQQDVGADVALSVNVTEQPEALRTGKGPDGYAPSYLAQLDEGVGRAVVRSQPDGYQPQLQTAARGTYFEAPAYGGEVGVTLPREIGVPTALAPDARAAHIRGVEMNRRFAPATSLMTDAQLRALQIRGEAMNRLHVQQPFVRDVPDGFQPQTRMSPALVRDVPDGHQPQLRVTEPVATPAVSTREWGDVGIGLAIGIALSLLAAGALVAGRSRMRTAHA